MRGWIVAAGLAVALSGSTRAHAQGSTYQVTLGSPRFTIAHTKGGVSWQPLSRPGHRMAGEAIAELGTPHAAFLHWEHHAGWRFDLARFEPEVQLYNFVHYSSLEEMYSYYEKPNVVFVLPVGLSAYSAISDHTYPWITPEYSAAFVQYVCGRADATPRAPSWGSNDFHAASADPNYNWANLRAVRGRVQPWPCAHVLAGTEPNMAEALTSNSGQEYADHFVPFFRELERRLGTPLPFRISVFIGSENLYEKWVDRVIPAFKPFAQRSPAGLVINNRFDPGGSMPFLEQILWRASVKRVAQPAWWYSKVGVQGPERAFIGPEYAERLVDAFGLPAETKRYLYWASWTASNMNVPNDVRSMLMYAVNYGLAFSGSALPTATNTSHVNYNSPWIWAAIWDGKSIVSLQKDHVTVEKTPAYHMHRLFGDGFTGSRLMNFTVTGGTKVTMAQRDATYEASELQLWITKKSNGDLDLWVVNPSETNTHTITGLNGYAISRWQRVRGNAYLTQNTGSGPIGIETVQRSTLTFDPLSVNRVTLSAGGGGGGGTGPIWGDVSVDGVVNSTDALGTLSHTVGLPNAQFDYSVADVSADGAITTLDALIDLYYSVGLDVSEYRVGQPVGSGGGDRVLAPQAQRVPSPADGRVYVGLRPSQSGARRPEAAHDEDVELTLRAARSGVEAELGAFHVRLTWDPEALRFVSAASASGSGQVLVAVNEDQAPRGVVTVAAATTEAFDVELLRLQFRRLVGSPPGASDVKLEVLQLTAATSGADLLPTVELRQETSELEEGAEPLGLPYPNPAPGRLRVPLRLGADGGLRLAGGGEAGVELSVYDLRGRRVRRLLAPGSVVGDQDVEWDGTDEAGRRVPAGIYVVELRSGEVRQTRKVVLY